MGLYWQSSTYNHLFSSHSKSRQCWKKGLTTGPCTHNLAASGGPAIVIQALGNWLTLSTVAVSCSPLGTTCNPPSQLLTVNGEIGRKGHQSQSCLMTVGDLLNDLCKKNHKTVCNHILSHLTAALLNNEFSSPCCRLI